MYAELIDSSTDLGAERLGAEAGDLAAGTAASGAFVSDVGYLVAAACVIFYAYQRFNTPAHLRYTTTVGQYRMAMIGYVFAAFALYSGLAWALRVNPEVGQLFVAMAPGTVTPEQARLPAPFVAALFLTVFLPKFPGLRKLDSGMQDYFRKLGEIPRQALRLSYRIQRATLRIPSARRGAVVRRLTDHDLDPRLFLDAAPDSTEALWAKIVALKIEIENYGGARPGFKLLQEDEIKRLDQTFTRQNAMAGVVYKGGRRDAALKRTFRGDCRDLLSEMSEIVARGMFYTHRDMRSVLAKLAEWGLEDIDKDFDRLSWNQIAGVALGTAAYLLVFFLIFGTSSVTGVPEKLKLAVTIGVIMGAAVACATLPKSIVYRGTRTAGGSQSRFLFYLFASLCAGASWFVIHAVRLGLEGTSDPATIISEIWPNRPWILMPIATAFFTAWLTDNIVARWGVAKPYRNWVEGLVMAGALVGAMFIVQSYRLELDPAALGPVPLYYYLIAGGGIGFLIGFFVPTLYRRIPENERRLDEERQAARRDDYQEPDAAGTLLRGARGRLARILPGPGRSEGLTATQLTMGVFGLLVATWEIGRHLASKARGIVS